MAKPSNDELAKMVCDVQLTVILLSCPRRIFLNNSENLFFRKS